MKFLKTSCFISILNNEMLAQCQPFSCGDGFNDAFSTEQQEKEYLGMPPEKELRTRLMYFDLILLSDMTP